MRNTNKITRANVNEAISRLCKQLPTTDMFINKIMDKAIELRDEYQTIKEWKDAVYYSFK